MIINDLNQLVEGDIQKFTKPDESFQGGVIPHPMAGHSIQRIYADTGGLRYLLEGKTTPRRNFLESIAVRNCRPSHSWIHTPENRLDDTENLIYNTAGAGEKEFLEILRQPSTGAINIIPQFGLWWRIFGLSMEVWDESGDREGKRDEMEG